MAKIIVVKTTGEYVTLPADDKLDIRLIYLAIGCNTVERIKVRYEGRVRDCYVDEEGWLPPAKRPNPELRKLAEAYYGRPCQDFAGAGAIWIPTPRKPKSTLTKSDPPEIFGA
jgi:hypothetical protein